MIYIFLGAERLGQKGDSTRNKSDNPNVIPYIFENRSLFIVLCCFET